MKSDIAIVTVPSQPPSKTNYGFLTLVLLADMLGRKLNATRYLYLNKQHSYKDKSLAIKELLSNLTDLDIRMDSILFDNDYTEKFYQDLSFFQRNGYIKTKDIAKLRCSCGKVDCVDIPGISYNIIQQIDDFKSCKHCGGKCDNISEKSLIFKFPTVAQKDRIRIVPKRFENKSMEFYTKLENSEMLISKTRNTGLEYEYNGDIYNIDIDFMLFNYLSNIPQKKRVIVGTSHVIYHMVMMELMDNLKNPDNENIFISMPYVMGTCSLPKTPDLENYKKQIYMLGSVTKNSDSQFNESLFQLVTKDRKENYLRSTYDILMQQSVLSHDLTFAQNINSVYMNEFNMNNISKQVTEKLKQDKLRRQIEKNKENTEQR